MPGNGERSGWTLLRYTRGFRGYGIRARFTQQAARVRCPLPVKSSSIHADLHRHDYLTLLWHSVNDTPASIYHEAPVRKIRGGKT